MAIKELFVGTVGPFLIDDTDPLYPDNKQVALKGDLNTLTGPAVTVTDETAYGITPVVGTSLNAAREDHTHGSPIAPDFAFRSDKIKFTSEGGLAILLTNKTGASSVKGNVVCVSSTTDNAVNLVVDGIPDAFGVIYTAGVADGSEIWVVISGIAEVYFIGSVTRKWLARTFDNAESGYVIGQAIGETFPSPPFATDKHFMEIGHILESRTGAGLAKVNLHFN